MLTENVEYLEQCITKAILSNKTFLVTIQSVFDPDFFDSPELRAIYMYVKDYMTEYKEIPDRSIVINNVKSSSRESVKAYLDDIDRIDIDIAKNYDWLTNQTDLLLKDRAIKDAIRKSVDVIDRAENTLEIRTLVESALCKTIFNSIGLDYFGQLGERLTRMFTDDTQRLKTYFPELDELMNGGFPPKTLSVFVAKIHGFKSNVMANIIARQVLNGHNIALASLEMSEDMFAQRFDGIFSLLDINRIYFNERLKQELVTRLRETKGYEGRGNLFIKNFPTGKASVNDFRIWVRELEMRGIKLSGFYFDYLNLMKSTEVKGENGTYSSVKSIAEETRAMGFEFNIPMISVSQLNRGGTFMSFEDVDFNSIAESMGVPATADFMMIMGSNDDHMVYQNEVHWKNVKNRFGGRVGDMSKFFYDARSMKMYCATEMEQWMEDVRHSGDDRNMKSQNEPQEPTGERRETRRRKKKQEEEE